MKKNKNNAAVFIINSLQNGGAERVVVNMATKLSERGIHVILIMIHDAKYYYISNDIETIILWKKEYGIKKVMRILALSHKLDKVLAKIYQKYNVILNTAHLPYTHWIARFSKYRDQILFVMHNPQFQFKFSQTAIFKLKLRFLYSKLQLVAVSNGVRKELIENYNLDKNNIQTIYNPIDFDAIDNKLRSSDKPIIKTPYILSAGRLTHQKRFDRLLRAFKKSKLFNEYKLVILGVGEEEDKLKILAHELHLENKVIFYGWSNNVYMWMKYASMFICSSDYESFGMTLIEAIYCDCKVVSTDCDYGPREILVGNLVNYLSKLDSDSLAHKMRIALNNYPTLSSNYVKKFEVNNIIKQYIDLYTKIKDF